MPDKLAGKLAVITGSGGDLGAAQAQLLARRGAHVIVQDLREDKCAVVTNAIESEGGSAQAMIGDITDLGWYRSALESLETDMGSIDILINNAGISGQAAPFEDVDENFFDRMIAVHVKASYFGAQAVVPGMKRRKYGKIINIGSAFAIKGSPSASHYTTAKGALHGLTKALALELAPWHICVNAVAPSLIETNMTINSVGKLFIESFAKSVPMGNLASPIDVATVVAFLVSADSDFITGQIIATGGGDVIS